MEAIILAGGLGTRLREAVPDLPKPMAPIHNRPFLEHQMDYWIGQGVTRFVLSVGYKHEVIEAHFGDSYRGCPIRYAREIQPLGTGGGLLLGLAHVQGSVALVLNGDTFFEVNLQNMLQQHERCQADVTIALRQVAKNDRYGEVALDDQSRVTAFGAAAQGKAGIINGGVYLLRPDVLLGLGVAPGESAALEQELFLRLIQQKNNIRGFISDAKFIDIGVPEDYGRAAEFLAH